MSVLFMEQTEARESLLTAFAGHSGEQMDAVQRYAKGLDGRLRSCGCGSWACPRCGASLGVRLWRRLRRRFRGKRVIMVTLTVDRSKFENNREAWEYQRRNHAVSRAIMAWYRARGLDGAGHWIAKMELQATGWVHWHALLEIPRDLHIAKLGEFDEFWGMGFSNVRTRFHNRYICTYASKANEPLQAVKDSGLPDKGLTWVSASRGFWDEPPSVVEGWEKPEPPRYVPDGDIDGDASFDVSMIEQAEREAKEATLYCRVSSCGGSCEMQVWSGVKGSKAVRIRIPVPAVDMAEAMGRWGALEGDDGEWDISFGVLCDCLYDLPVGVEKCRELLGALLEWATSGKSGL